MSASAVTVIKKKNAELPAKSARAIAIIQATLLETFTDALRLLLQADPQAAFVPLILLCTRNVVSSKHIPVGEELEIAFGLVASTYRQAGVVLADNADLKKKVVECIEQVRDIIRFARGSWTPKGK